MSELAVVERALVVIAVTQVLQTALIVVGLAAAWIGYRRAATAVDREMRELRAKTAEVVRLVQQAGDAVGRGTDAVSAVVDDARHAVETVGSWSSVAATALGTPRAAAALGVLRGIQWWRSRRARRNHAAWVDG
jgi:hypothetical protein